MGTERDHLHDDLDHEDGVEDGGGLGDVPVAPDLLLPVHAEQQRVQHHDHHDEPLDRYKNKVR